VSRDACRWRGGALTRLGTLAALLALALPLQPARGQSPISLTSGQGQIGVEFLGLWSDYDARPGIRQTNFREWAEARVRGAILDPRFLSLRLRIRPEWQQSSWGGETDVPNQTAARLGWNGSLSLLEGRPVSLTMTTLRSTATTRSEIGAETGVTRSEFTSSLRARLRYLPMRLTFRRYTQDHDVRSGPQPVRQWFTSSRLRLSAKNTKTQLTLERHWYDDRLQQLNDFAETHGWLHHLFRWGKGSSIASDVDYVDRAGGYPYRNLSWFERVHLQHTRTIHSEYEFRMGSTRAGLASSSFRSLGAAVSFPATSALRARIEGSSLLTRFDIGHESILRVGPRLEFAARLPFRSRLSVGTSLMYERAAQQPAGDQWVPVAGEQHIVDVQRSFFLDRAAVDLPSVRVLRNDRTLVYQSAFDYELVESGPFVEVVILPTGQIQVGDTLLVDYRHQLVPQASREQLVATLNVHISTGPFLAYSYSRLTGSLAADEPPPLPVATGNAITSLRDLDEIVFGLRVRGKMPIGHADAGFERSVRRADTYRIETFELRATWSFTFGSGILGTVQGAMARTEGTDGPSRTLSGNASIVWWAHRSLSLRATLGSWQRRVDDSDASFIGGGLAAEWRRGKFLAVLRYDHSQWDEISPRLDDRVSVILVREF
jgi:hypothetical protein